MTDVWSTYMDLTITDGMDGALFYCQPHSVDDAYALVDIMLPACQAAAAAAPYLVHGDIQVNILSTEVDQVPYPKPVEG